MENNRLEGIKRFKNDYNMDDSLFNALLNKADYYNNVLSNTDPAVLKQSKNNGTVKKFFKSFDAFNANDNGDVIFNSLSSMLNCVVSFIKNDQNNNDFKYSDPERRHSTFRYGAASVNTKKEIEAKLIYCLDNYNANKPSLTNLIFNTENVRKLNKMLVSGYRMKASNTEKEDEYTAIVTDKGTRIHNEDAALAITHPGNKEFRLVAVADGMGGHSAGDRFSHETLRQLSNWFNCIPDYYYYRTDLLYPALCKKIREINDEFKMDMTNGGNTLVLSIVCENELLCLNIGDSRLYGYNSVYGNLKLLSEDESRVWTNGFPAELDRQRFHKNNNEILNCLFSYGNVKIDQVFTVDRNSFDRLVLCTDGVSDMMSFSEMNNLLNRSGTNLEMARALVGKATTEDTYSDYYYGPEYNTMLKAGKDNATCLVTTVSKPKVHTYIHRF